MIRKASIGDIESIMGIYDKIKLYRNRLSDSEYESKIQKNGFVLGLDTISSMANEIKEAFEFLVAEEENKIVGYLIADHGEKQKFYDDEYKTWFDLGLKELYYQNSKGMTIATIAVDPEFVGEGVATGLLHVLEDRLHKEAFNYLFSIVTLSPITNCPSIIWHTKNGFKRLAMGRPRKLFELDNYSGILLYKKLG